MRILIYGAGAMGTSLGVLLAKAGHPCELVTRNRAHVGAMKEHGARLLTAKGKLSSQVTALLPEEMTGKYDVIFLATKQRENRALAHFLLAFLKEDGALVTVQNGLPEEGLAEIFGEDRVYGCALGWGAELAEPGVVSVTSEEFCLAIGACGRGERLSELSRLLSSAAVLRTGKLCEIRFSKLAVNASFSTLSAISGLTFGELAKKHRTLVLALMRETVAVAEACGCERLVQNGHDVMKLIKSPFARLMLPFAMRKHKDIRSGMLKDITAGRRCDVDFVAGAVVKAGAERGVDTPRLSRAVALVHDAENGLCEISPESLRLF